uniref:JmjC domain-containing protein n=1 Tax=Panagrellus redivivus TaxID=6233 RepID=A0A7E4VA69_PANRE
MPQRVDPNLPAKPFPFLAPDDYYSYLNNADYSYYNDTYAPKKENRPPPPMDAVLPKSFSLLSRLHVPVTVTSSDILYQCNVRAIRPDAYDPPIFDELAPPPNPSVIPLDDRPDVSELALKTPLFKIQTIEEANSDELRKSCFDSSIAVIRGLANTVGFDLSSFTTKALLQLQPEYPVDVRTQYGMPSDVNVNATGKQTWRCSSMQGDTDIFHYGIYQGEVYQQLDVPSYTNPKMATTMLEKAVETRGPSSKRLRPDDQVAGTEYKPKQVVEFCTNVDLSDDTTFAAQLHELNKLPAFLRNSTSRNSLHHLDYSILGMNTVQMYMKVPGCRTPGHLENNCFSSVNINIGPGDCEWFGVDYKYWPVINQLCEERGIHLMNDAWWPNFEDLVRARVPVYRFLQKTGDVVWVGGGCVHWVQAVGCCNNVAWNVGPITPKQLKMSLFSYEWNKLTNFQSLVPMQRLCWKLASHAQIENREMFNVIKGVLIRSLAFCRMVYDHVESCKPSSINIQKPVDGEVSHYCERCTVEVFNIIFTKTRGNKVTVHCAFCAKRTNFKDYTIFQEIEFSELSRIFDAFSVYSAKAPLLQ